MSISENIQDQLSVFKDFEKQLNSQLKYVKQKKQGINELINKSATFDEYIIELITKLITLKEKEIYKPFLYKESHTIKYNRNTKAEDYYIGISSDWNLVNFIRDENSSLIDFFDNKQGYEILYKKTDILQIDGNNESKIVDYYNYDKDRLNNKTITFRFLLKKFNISKLDTCMTSVYDFEDFDYVQDFITYLFELQYMNNGKKLTYDEMNYAFNNYISLSQKKDKIIH